ncbi:hypothetical protein DPMN_107866 [Dreissena polymorpha]|uniref:Uncharacterized protein n=1 Tax=Dreissena polymorpha TaxID=45954 RepID=A0A9D4K7Y9_DREPO|nr:hypothetical protein DPMN_107866 [Dreissena polymorpha]
MKDLVFRNNVAEKDILRFSVGKPEAPLGNVFASRTLKDSFGTGLETEHFTIVAN